jgi:hypothetical protein
MLVMQRVLITSLQADYNQPSDLKSNNNGSLKLFSFGETKEALCQGLNICAI